MLWAAIVLHFIMMLAENIVIMLAEMQVPVTCNTTIKACVKRCKCWGIPRLPNGMSLSIGQQNLEKAVVSNVDEWIWKERLRRSHSEGIQSPLQYLSWCCDCLDMLLHMHARLYEVPHMHPGFAEEGPCLGMLARAAYYGHLVWC